MADFWRNLFSEELSKDNREFPFEFSKAKKVIFYPEPPADNSRYAGNVLEVGPGLGHFLLELADQNPDKQYVAIESQTKRYNRICEKARKFKFNNVVVLQGFAQVVIPAWCEAGSFERVYVLFPDPWPKTRHACNRLLTTDFISMLACLLKIDGELFMATDHLAYAKWIIQAAEKVNSLENIGNPYCDQKLIADYVPTIFEKKWVSEGKHICYMKYIKTDRNPSSPIGLDKS